MYWSSEYVSVLSHGTDLRRYHLVVAVLWYGSLQSLVSLWRWSHNLARGVRPGDVGSCWVDSLVALVIPVMSPTSLFSRRV